MIEEEIAKYLNSLAYIAGEYKVISFSDNVENKANTIIISVISKSQDKVYNKPTELQHDVILYITGKKGGSGDPSIKKVAKISLDLFKQINQQRQLDVFNVHDVFCESPAFFQIDENDNPSYQLQFSCREKII